MAVDDAISAHHESPDSTSDEDYNRLARMPSGRTCRQGVIMSAADDNDLLDYKRVSIDLIHDPDLQNLFTR